jgi:hypothetical protein
VENKPSSVQANPTIRRIATAILASIVALWAEAGLALFADDQVMQCSMTLQKMQAMGAMTCCPHDDASVPALSEERPPCCSVSSTPECPLGFVVTSERTTGHSLDVASSLPQQFAAPGAQHIGVWRSADAARFIKPALESKTDLKI